MVELSTRPNCQKPGPHRLSFGIVEVGVNRKNTSNPDLYPGFLEEFTPGGIADILVPLDVAARYTPLPAL